MTHLSTKDFKQTFNLCKLHARFVTPHHIYQLIRTQRNIRRNRKTNRKIYPYFILARI